MNNLSKTFLVGNLLAASVSLSATDLLPMQQSDQKNFKANDNTFTMEVVDTYGENWKKYSTFLGQKDQWVNASPERSSVYILDNNGDVELFVDFNDSEGTEYNVELENCTSSVVLQKKSHSVTVAAGNFRNTALLTFNGSCADAGLATATFAPGVGLVAYSQQSIIGPINTEMTSATINGVEYPVFGGVEAMAQFPAGVVLSNVQNKVSAYLTLTNKSSDDAVFQFNTSQTFDIEIRNSVGEVVSLWSANKRFMMALQEIVLAPGESRTFGGDISLVDFQNQPLDLGSYVIRIVMKGSNHPAGSVFTAIPFAAESPLFIDQRVTIAN